MSLEMTPFDAAHESSYWRTALTVTLSCIVFEISEILVEDRKFCI